MSGVNFVHDLVPQVKARAGVPTSTWRAINNGDFLLAQTLPIDCGDADRHDNAARESKWN